MFTLQGSSGHIFDNFYCVFYFSFFKLKLTTTKFRHHVLVLVVYKTLNVISYLFHSSKPLRITIWLSLSYYLGIAVSSSLSTYMKYVDASSHLQTKPGTKTGKTKDPSTPQNKGIAYMFVGMMTCFLISYTFHCTWVTSEAYSSPSIVLSARSHDGSRIIFDDFREAYWWLRMNTPEDAKVRRIKKIKGTVNAI